MTTANANRKFSSSSVRCLILATMYILILVLRAWQHAALPVARGIRNTRLGKVWLGSENSHFMGPWEVRVALSMHPCGRGRIGGFTLGPRRVKRACEPQTGPELLLKGDMRLSEGKTDDDDKGEEEFDLVTTARHQKASLRSVASINGNLKIRGDMPTILLGESIAQRGVFFAMGAGWYPIRYEVSQFAASRSVCAALRIRAPWRRIMLLTSCRAWRHAKSPLKFFMEVNYLTSKWISGLTFRDLFKKQITSSNFEPSDAGEPLN
ncbi:hypothetical protein FA15DRAFT_651788 [Coprinopsis marcescibilis]|uniref:Uncharacterized protein n=1 Tax=Coprinopsis marcescibilis TaxID=230819 RepID=A0A5C3LBS4_COPMA|nr:hypothetical protein FA15DRAFT_651788 [Coprinopsis marcescibilis]